MTKNSPHKPVFVETMSLSCYDGQCEHNDDRDCLQTVEVCDTCRETLFDDDDLEMLVPWPCDVELKGRSNE